MNDTYDFAKCMTFPFGHHVISTSSNHSPFFTACDQLVVPIGATHISLPLHQIQSREQEKKKRTNEQTLEVNSSAEGELCNIVHEQTNASVESSETSTKLLECRLILTRSSFTGLDPLSCRLVSQLRCPVSTASVRRPSPTHSPSLTGVPSPLPVTSRLRVQNPLSGFADHIHSVTSDIMRYKSTMNFEIMK